jgi:molecular chaperone IbpA
MTTTDIAGLFLLDFPRFVTQIEHARSQEVRRFVGNYPPVNIIRKDDNWVIQIALAGYAPSDVEITTEDGHLIVKTAKHVDENVPEGVQYIHRGISQRAFERRWQLEADMEVIGAAFENGMLTIGVTRIIPEEKKPKTVPIGKSAKTIQDKLLTA